MAGLDEITDAIDPVVMSAQLRTNKVLRGKWHLDRLLGVGGMAAVYAATHRNGTRAAVKVLHPELSIHGHLKTRFLKEGYVANKVAHPGVVRVLDDDVDEDGSLYLVMELLDGESLEARRVRKGGKLDVDEVLSVAHQVLDVLAVANEKGIVHRDIKPENIFLTREGLVKVLDFGVARLRELTARSSATQVGTTMGTPAFMAPEQARGLWDEVDGQSDLWSVGATMFALATGRMVHEARTANELLVAAVTQKAPQMQAVSPEMPTALAEVVDMALAYEKAERWPDARAMQEGVRAAYDRIRHAPIATYPPLVVPETVPNRTLPAAELELPPAPRPPGTGPAVASGRTGVPLGALGAPNLARNALILAGIVALGTVVVVAALVGSVIRNPTPESGVDPITSAPLGETALEQAASEELPVESDAGADATVASPSVTPTVSVPVATSPSQPVGAAPSSATKPPALPRVAPQPKVDWKEQRH